MGERVNILDLRVTFVEKTESEVGDSTQYPLGPLTVDQLAEIVYRVKDAKWTAGGFVFDEGLGFDAAMTVSCDFGDPPAELASWETYEWIMRRGYNILQNTARPQWFSAHDLTYFGVNYGPATPQLRSTFSVISWHPPQLYDPYGSTFTLIHDIGADERGMWTQAVSTETWDWSFIRASGDDSTGLGDEWFAASSFQTGFSYYGHSGNNDWFSAPASDTVDYVYPPQIFSSKAYNVESDWPGSGWPSGDYAYTIETWLLFTGAVAWVDTTGSGDPLDPGNSLYLGLNFRVAFVIPGDDLFGRFIQTYSEPADTNFPAMTDYIGNLNLVLSGSTVTAKIYAHAGTSAAYSSWSDFTVTATEWWPYADENGNPIWDSTTGLKIT